MHPVLTGSDEIEKKQNRIALGPSAQGTFYIANRLAWTIA
jgi:hypothetical protein